MVKFPLASVLFAFCLALPADGQVAPTQTAPKSPATQATSPVAQKPTGSITPTELLATMGEKLQVTIENDDLELYEKAVLAATREILVLADQVLAHPQATEEQKIEAYRFKASVLYEGTQMGDKTYPDRLDAFAEELVKVRPQQEIAAVASYLAIKARFETEAGLAPGALPKISQFVKDFPGNGAAVTLLQDVGMEAEYANDIASAKAAFGMIANQFPEDPVAELVPGILRRLEAVGKPANIVGQDRDGKPIRLDSLKGKVVIVDFWATWCGPCLAELPRLVALHKEYHSRGLEIIGIPLDDDPADVDTFLKENPLPWRQLVFQDATQRGPNHPILREYGINAIPVVFLIDAQGNVVSTTLRGPDLEKKIAELLPAATARRETTPSR